MIKSTGASGRIHVAVIILDVFFNAEYYTVNIHGYGVKAEISVKDVETSKLLARLVGQYVCLFVCLFFIWVN